VAAPDPPADVRGLADRRAAARGARDFAAADELRDAIAASGWLVRDTADGYSLAPAPPYDVVQDVRQIPERTGNGPQRATIALLVEGWPDDVRACVDALVAHLPEAVGVLALDVGNVDGAGDVVHDLAAAHPGLVDELHVEQSAAYGPARAALLRYDTAPVHIWMETSTIVEGDAVTPLLAALDDPAVVGAGWRGADVDDDWRSFHDAGPGEVEAVLGYVFAMRRAAALAVASDPASPLAKARGYRNVDLELSFWLRETGGTLIVPPDLPVRQERHRGYNDTEPALRDRESKRNYDRFLARFRGRDDLRIAH
jgi:hypothetical protein